LKGCGCEEADDQDGTVRLEAVCHGSGYGAARGGYPGTQRRQNPYLRCCKLEVPAVEEGQKGVDETGNSLAATIPHLSCDVVAQQHGGFVYMRIWFNGKKTEYWNQQRNMENVVSAKKSVHAAMKKLPICEQSVVFIC
jgi:hypothetical protein